MPHHSQTWWSRLEDSQSIPAIRSNILQALTPGSRPGGAFDKDELSGGTGSTD